MGRDGCYTGDCNPSVPATYGERFLAWQHLANAGLVEGRYTGASANSGFLYATPGTNLPKLKIGDGGGLTFAWIGVASGSANVFDGSYNANTFFTQYPTAPLKAEEAWNIDTKLDDGNPATGAVFAPKSTSSYGVTCTTTDVVSTTAYNVSSSSNTCPLWFKVK
jgi:hypothetical protein